MRLCCNRHLTVMKTRCHFHRHSRRYRLRISSLPYLDCSRHDCFSPYNGESLSEAFVDYLYPSKGRL